MPRCQRDIVISLTPTTAAPSRFVVPVCSKRRSALRDAEEPKRPRNLRVAGAKATRKPRGFYERVADLYRRLVAARDHAPAKAIAIANGVSVDVVHQWIKVCRRDELLGPAMVGRAGGGIRARAVEDVPPPERPDIDRTKTRRERKKDWDVDEGQP